MIRLMHNELVKLVKKKSFYIVTFIFVLFCVLTNVVYKMPLEGEIVSVDIEALKEENEALDLNNSEDLLAFVDHLTTIKLEELKNEYSSNVQEYLIDHFMYNTIYQMYESEYILKDQELSLELQSEVQEQEEHVKDEDSTYFLDERIHYLEARAQDTEGLEQARYQRLLELANIRKENNVSYDSSNYLHNSLEFLEENTVEYMNLLSDDDLTSDEEKRLEFLEEEMSIHEYVIEHKIDLLNEHTLRAVLMNFSGEFGLFILIYTIMIAGSIVSEEYSRGTIKLFVVLLSIPLIMIFMSLIEIIIGGFTLGFDSLSVPVVLYRNGVLESYSVLGYLFGLLFTSLPMYLIIGVFAFMLSVVTTSTSAAITVSFLFYLLLNVISNLALVYDFWVFKASASLYWDFSYLVTGTTQTFGANISTSILVLFIYIFVMLCIAYVIFGKKDVKNI